MSGQFRRMSDLVDDVRYRFSTAGVKNRHPPDRIINLLNIGLQELRTIVSLASDSSYLQATAVLALPTTAAIAGEVYAEVDFPLNAVSVYGVRVQLTASGRWFPLKRIPWAAYQDYQMQGFYDGFTRQRAPCAYILRELQKGIEDVETAGKVMILPVPQGGNYRLWYLEAWQPQVEDSDIFSGHESWLEFVIYATLIRMLGPDADSRKMYEIWSGERDRARSLIEARAMRLSDGDAMEPRNARDDGYEFGHWGDDF